MKMKFVWQNLMVISIFLIFMGCNIDDTGESDARLRIKLTDSSSPSIKELYIDIKAIEAFVTGDSEAEGEWVAMKYSGGEYNLLALMNGKTVQLVDQYFSSDKTIKKIRVLLGENNRMLTVTDKLLPLQKSSEIIDGVLINNLEIELMPNVIQYIIIDINAALSVSEVNGNWFLNPVARAFAETTGGSIRGYVAPREANSFVAIVQEPDIFMTLPESDGLFYFFGLDEGVWDIHMIAHQDSDYGDTLFSVTISEGEKLELSPKPIQLPFNPN